jgi:hypothetical protein
MCVRMLTLQPCAAMTAAVDAGRTLYFVIRHVLGRERSVDVFVRHSQAESHADELWTCTCDLNAKKTPGVERECACPVYFVRTRTRRTSEWSKRQWTLIVSKRLVA